MQPKASNGPAHSPSADSSGQEAAVRHLSGTSPLPGTQGAGTKKIRMLPPLATDRPCTTLWGCGGALGENAEGLTS
jgi:hypothetical protein